MNRLKDKLVLITGASSGIGRACADKFAEGGARLILVARRLERLEELARELKSQHGTESKLLQLDVRDRAGVQEAFSNMDTSWQGVDILINNAGLALGLDAAPEASLDDWEQMIDTNIKGLLFVTKAILGFMVQRATGHIINIGSIAGHDPYRGGSVYCASKAAVNVLSRVLKMDLLEHGIRVSSVDPGLLKSEFSEVRFKGDKERAERVYQGKAPLNPEDVADAVYYCATRPAHVNISEMLILASAHD